MHFELRFKTSGSRLSARICATYCRARYETSFTTSCLVRTSSKLPHTYAVSQADSNSLAKHMQTLIEVRIYAFWITMSSPRSLPAK